MLVGGSRPGNPSSHQEVSLLLSWSGQGRAEGSKATCSPGQGQLASEVKKGHPEGAGWQAGTTAPSPHPGPQGPPVKGGAWSVRTMSPYQASPTGPAQCPAGACPPQASPLLPTCPGGTEETAEARAQPRLPASRLGALCENKRPGVGEPASQVQPWLPTDTNKQSLDHRRVWVVQSHLLSSSEKAAAVDPPEVTAWGLAAITEAKRTGGLRRVTSLGRGIRDCG